MWLNWLEYRPSKPRVAGSTPVACSKGCPPFLIWFACFSHKIGICSNDGTGRRAALKMRCRKACGFESHFEHHWYHYHYQLSGEVLVYRFS